MDTLFFKSKHGENPFEDEPLPTGHYHPSLHHNLTDKQKQITLSPQRLPKHDAIVPPATKTVDKRSPAQTEFLQKTNSLLAKELPSHDTPSPGNASSKFDESWPTSERPSTIESPSEYKTHSEIHVLTAEQRDRATVYATRPSMHTQPVGSSSSTSGPDYLSEWRNKHTSSNQEGQNLSTDGSTLAKYIQRFRYSEPKSRQEREREKQVNHGTDFWWLAPPSRTSTPTDDESRISMRHLGAKSQGQGRPTLAGRGRGKSAGRDRVSSGSVSTPEKTDTDTEDLQMRAERLLEISESTILSEPPVSSEGIGSSSPSSNYQDQDPKIKDIQRHTVDPIQCFRAPLPLGVGQHVMKRVGLRPEDDILHQWRIRRRLEEARRQPRRIAAEIGGLSVPELERQHHEGSRLEEFRERLKEHHLLSEAKPGPFQTLPSEPVTRTTGTSPIPQTVATQTNGAAPSFVEEVPVRDNSGPELPCKILDEVEMTSSQTSKKHIHNLGDIYLNCESGSEKYQTIKTGTSQPIIASPNIHRTADQKVKIQPHLHMACDIIPCPRDGSASQNVVPSRTQFGNGVEFVDDDAQQRQFEVERKNERLSVAKESSTLDGVTLREVPLSEDLKNQEEATDPKLFPPHPPILQSARLKPSNMDAANSHRLPERVYPSNVSRMDAGNGHRLSEEVRPNNNDVSRIDAGNSHRHPEGARLKKDDLPQRLDFEVEDENDSLRTSQDEFLLEDGVEGMRQAGNEAARISSPIGTAVGQVISDMLFTTPQRSICSPQSSIYSLPSMHSSMMSHRSVDQSTTIGDQPVDNIESSASSDDEECADDELLQLLRRRRAQYENQLQTLDRLIELQAVGT